MRARAGFIALSSVLLLSAAALAQPDGESDATAAPVATPESLAAAREKLAAELAALDAEELGTADRVLLRERLEELERTLLEHEGALTRAARAAAETDAPPLPEAVQQRLAEGPPYSVADLDVALDALDETRMLSRRLEQASEALTASVESAREALEEAERVRRRAREALETAAPGSSKRALEFAVRRRTLESRLAAETLALRQTERVNTRASLERVHSQERALAASAEQVRSQLGADPAELEDRRASLAKQRFDLERALAAVRLDLESAERRYRIAQQRLDAESTPSPELRAEVAARRAELTHGQRSLALLEGELARVEAAEEIWARRHRLAAGGVPDTDAESWYASSGEARSETERRQTLDRARLAELREELASLRRVAAEAAPEVARWLNVQTQSLERLVALYERELGSADQQLALQGRLLSELQRERETLSFRERLASLRRRAAEIWNTELTASEDRSITVGKVLSAVMVFVIGWFVARALAWLLGRRVLPRLRFDEGASQAFASLAFYAMLVVVFLTTLRTVDIPLTAFAVVGGALAIGIGFGSQNVVSNFISGLILLAERPLKVGDLVEVEGVYGLVNRIGLRSTRVRTGENIIIIVPNAAFLENKVVNWTHNDPLVRVKVRVGIVYGAPTREAERIIKEVINAHPRVQEHPEPVVLFMDFGDNALIFDTAFWIRMRSQMDRMQVESDIRFGIDDRFREAGIVIAFPQRDVHLDTLKPLEVRVLGSENAPD